MDSRRGIVNKKRALCLSVFLTWSVVASAELDVVETAKTLTQYMYMQNLNKPKEERIQALDEIKDQIAVELESKPGDPVILWLDGLSDLSYVYAWNLSWKDDPKNIDIIQGQKMVAVEKFRKALELDNPDDPKLDINMLYSLKKFGSSDVHVKAAQRILDGGPKLDRLQEIELRGGMITHFMRLGHYDDVMQQIAIFEEKFPETDIAQNGRRLYEEKIRDLPHGGQKQQSENGAEEKVISPAKQPESEQPAQETVDPVTGRAGEYQHWILMLALLAIGVGVVVYIIRRLRKKQ